MKRYILSTIIVSLALILAMPAFASAADTLTSKDPGFLVPTASNSDAEDVAAFPARVEKFIPKKLAYKPKKARKLLVYVQANTFRTPGEPYVNLLLKMLAEKTGAFEVEFSSNIDVFLPENLNKYDAFLLNSTVNMNKDNVSLSETATPEICRSILDFVKSGKGAIGMHGAVDNFNQWPAGQGLFGNLFRGHPWNENGAWAVKVDEPENILNSPFKGHKGFKTVTELYASQPPVYSRDKQLVLLSLDMADETTAAQATTEADKDTGVSWIKEYGKGRVFYTNFGHGGNHKGLELENTPVIEHILLGIQWAMGDIDGVDAPKAADLTQGISVKAGSDAGGQPDMQAAGPAPAGAPPQGSPARGGMPPQGGPPGQGGQAPAGMGPGGQPPAGMGPGGGMGSVEPPIKAGFEWMD